MKSKTLEEHIADNIIFQVAWLSLCRKEYAGEKITVADLFEEASKVLNYVEKYKIKI